MIRFRFNEDERKYQRLFAEVFRIVATHLPAAATSLVIRNLGKLEQIAYLEGVRQGLAVAEISILAAQQGHPHARSLKAFQAHAMVYGSTDTPLRQVEEEWLEQIGVRQTVSREAWLDEKPLRFAPQTLEEAVGEIPEAHPTPHFARIEELDPSLSEPFLNPIAAADDEVQQPASLDRIRDLLNSSSHKPESWPELILFLHRNTGIDAGFLDLQMSTPMGRTVLTQCGIHVDPGAGVDLSSLAAAGPPDTENSGGGAPHEDGAEPGPDTV